MAGKLEGTAIASNTVTSTQISTTVINRIDAAHNQANSAYSQANSVGAVAGGAIYENTLTIESNYTITANRSAFSVGPINIANGVSVTVPSGSKWVIL